jgi:arylsulfatase A-like enzyme
MFVGDAHYDAGRRAPLNPGRDDDMHGIPERARLGDHDELAYYVAQYDAEIRYMDHEVGRLLRGIEAALPRERTAVILTADHGESLGEHAYYFEHGRLPYETCTRVPLVVRAPGGLHAARGVERPVTLVDLMPTLLGFAGLAIPEEAEGRSLVPLLAGADDPDRSAFVFTQSGYSQAWQRTVRDERWKLVHVRDPADRALMTGAEWELYDLLSDPGETRNLAGEEPEQANRLRAALDAWVAAGPRNAVLGPGAVRLDADTEERLRRLGYVE